MRIFPRRLGPKLNLSLLVFLLLLGAATASLVLLGFQRTQDDAQQRSRDALEDQGKLALQAVAGGAAEQGGLLFESAAATGRRAARYLDAANELDAQPPFEQPGLAVSTTGVLYDPRPNRTSDLVLLNGASADNAAVQDDIAFSAALDTIAPVLLESVTGEGGDSNFDPIAIVFISTNSASRYYPPSGIHDVLPATVDITQRMEAIGPINNPERRTIWTAPYADAAGKGQIVTARTPVYDGDTFRGSLEVDLSMARLTDAVDGVNATERGFAFYVDTQGDLLRSAAFDLLDREAGVNPDLAAILESMKRPDRSAGVRVEQLPLGDEEYFVAYAPLPSLGGSFAVAAPVSDITARSAAITAGIDNEGRRTVAFILTTMLLLFAAALVGAAWLNRRTILRPIEEIVTGTHAIAAGDLNARIPVRSTDELGMLADSFNRMTTEVQDARESLEQRVQEQTRELTTLLDLSHTVASTLDTEELVGLVLDQLKKIIDYTGASVSLIDGGMLTVMASRATRGDSKGARIPVADASLWSQILRLEPVIIDDIRDAANPLAVAYLQAIGDLIDTPGFREIRSWMAVPLAPKDRAIGMLTMSRTEPGYFTARHARLARAVADQAAVAIENARLFEETQRRGRETEALFRADEQLFQSLSLDAVFQALVDVCVDVLGVPKSMVTTIDDADGHYTVRASRNIAQSSLDLMLRIRDDQPRRVLAGISESIVNHDARSIMPEMEPVFAAEGIFTTVDVPIKSSGTLRGVLGAAYTSKRAISADELRLLQALAERAAVAIDNAELYERAQQVASLEERQKLARELHDSVSQALYGIALGARTARTLLDRDPAKAVEPVDYVLSLAEAGLTEMRALIFELRPESLEMEGLVVAIEKNVAATQARYGIEVTADLCSEPKAPLDVKEAAYRIAQEALHNIVKHAQATRVDIRLTSDDGALTLVVEDNGVGFDSDGAFPGHIGLRSMRERTAKNKGTIEIASTPGEGTRITARLRV